MRKVFAFAAGPQTLALRAREADTRLDRICVTSDPNYDPNVVTPLAAPLASVAGNVIVAAKSADGRLTLRYRGEAGRASQLETSTDLRKWRTVLVTNSANGAFEWSEPPGERASQRFCRVVRP